MTRRLDRLAVARIDAGDRPGVRRYVSASGAGADRPHRRPNCRCRNRPRNFRRRDSAGGNDHRHDVGLRGSLQPRQRSCWNSNPSSAPSRLPAEDRDGTSARRRGDDRAGHSRSRASTVQLETHVVTAEIERGSVSTALDAQRNATGIVNSVTAEQIGKSPDSRRRTSRAACERRNGAGWKVRVRARSW